jgi:hypothetical protein
MSKQGNDSLPTPSLLDLLKLERMWVNEPTEELESITRKHKSREGREGKKLSTSKRENSSNLRGNRKTSASVSKGPIIVRSISICIAHTTLEVNEKYEVNTIYDPSLVHTSMDNASSGSTPRQKLRTHAKDDQGSSVIL